MRVANGRETINGGLVIASCLHARQHPDDRERRTVLVAMPEDNSPEIREYVVSSVYGTSNNAKLIADYAIQWDSGWAQGRYFPAHRHSDAKDRAVAEFTKRLTK
jgi:hypothetical protein